MYEEHSTMFLSLLSEKVDYVGVKTEEIRNNFLQHCLQTIISGDNPHPLELTNFEYWRSLTYNTVTMLTLPFGR